MSGKFNENDKSISCSVCQRCGACDYIKVPYEKELSEKKNYINKLFKGICTFDKVNGMYRPAFYRNKVHAVVGLDRDKNIITGTYEEGTHNIIAVDECMIEDSKADEIMATLRQLFKSFKYVPFNEDTKRGFIRHVLIRRGFSTKEIMVVLVTSDIMFPSKNNFIKALRNQHPEITTIIQNINGMSTSMVLGKRSKTLYGKGYIEDVLCGCRFRISAESFYQINPVQTEKLYKAAIKMGNITNKDTVIDAYCGIGTIGISVASHAGRVIGVELNSQAVKDAQVNAGINNIKNIEFINKDAGEFLIEYAQAKGKADVVIMDPPRSGSTPEFIRSVLKMKPRKVVYISCDPSTQVRDVRLFMRGGYKVDSCAWYDLFPHTKHVETVVLLSQQKPDDRIEVEIELDELDLTSAESKATYAEIKEYVLKEHGLKVSSLYISQIKRKCGIEVGENYNLSKSEDSRQPQCPVEKEKAIKDALEHFGMI